MLIINQVRQRQVQARKAKEGDVTINLLTTLLSEITMCGKNAPIPHETTDNEAVAVIKKFLKNVHECLSIARDRQNGAWVDQLIIEKNLLESFLPCQLTQDQLTVVISTIIGDNGIKGSKEIGLVMKLLKEQFDGLYDRKDAFDLTRKLLSPE